MRSILSGLIGGAISVLLTVYIARRVGRAVPPGTLRFGGIVWVLAVACLVFALVPMASFLYFGSEGQLLARLFLLLGFGLAAIYCFGEAAFVKGSYNDEEIEFFTPWTGLKKETWNNLESIEFNSWVSWYTLSFRSGKRIRLSRYLSGHLSLLDLLGYGNNAR